MRQQCRASGGAVIASRMHPSQDATSGTLSGDHRWQSLKFHHFLNRFMTVQKASKGDNGKAGDEQGGERAINADSDEATTAFFGSSDGDGAGRAVFCRHAAILRYEIQTTRMIRPAGPHHVVPTRLPRGRMGACRHFESIRPEVLTDGKERRADFAIRRPGLPHGRRPRPTGSYSRRASRSRPPPRR